MDILKLLKDRLEGIPDGAYSDGLRAISLHIEMAIYHLTNAKQAHQEALYTDSIYRCNQAFEGSLKEAYRVLANGDPDKRSPHEIEQHFTKNKLLKDRVVSLFTEYRQKWRNPSTHDHKLYFDENESFLAITSVCSFAYVLAAQIQEQLSYQQGKDVAAASLVEEKHEKASSEGAISLREICTNHILEFAKSEIFSLHDTGSEPALVALLAGYLSTYLHGHNVILESPLDGKHRADILVQNAEQRLIIEVKRRQKYNSFNALLGFNQVFDLMKSGKIEDGILFMAPENFSNLSRSEWTDQSRNIHITILAEKPFLWNPSFGS